MMKERFERRQGIVKTRPSKNWGNKLPLCQMRSLTCQRKSPSCQRRTPPCQRSFNSIRKTMNARSAPCRW
ncbi:hypothetical protein BKA56DRAFT_584444 [Ilyonectria sp. MPI-CAGE-AT-0026]|nr:hypothetical protein BKA56DRAFT_584444 [Ilyonectria sp. MPI-CAGE-AT-0026]